MVVSGSSPLARGTPRSLFLLLVVIRLIPARAGNTPDAFLTVTRCAAHPRSRGEHTCVGCGSRRGCGSSPLARGTLVIDVCRPMDERLIPARAGNTQKVTGRAHTTPAHPRSRGEHIDMLALFLLLCGSSPLARGTPSARPAAHTYPRLIPARAGNTSGISSAPSSPQAHPRSRGEHCEALRLSPSAIGSSPLARGTRNQRVGLAVPARLIPARAGNTPQSAAQYQASVAHPRSRGEHTAPMNVWDGFRGSSPLARGTRHKKHHSFIAERLIPARAGNT